MGKDEMMAKTTGFSQLTCDRCGETIYATDNAPAAQSWRDVQRYTADGTAISRLLCPACNASYRDMAQKQDAAFGDFMAKREGEEE